MGITVKINALQDALDADPQIHTIGQNQITIGSFNDDSIKLDYRKLDGKHIRIHSEWNRNSGETRLVVTNISGSSRLLVGNRLLNADETQVLDENMRVQMGEFRLTASIVNAEIPSLLTQHLNNLESTADDASTSDTSEAAEKHTDGEIESADEFKRRTNTRMDEPLSATNTTEIDLAVESLLSGLEEPNSTTSDESEDLKLKERYQPSTHENSESDSPADRTVGKKESPPETLAISESVEPLHSQNTEELGPSLDDEAIEHITASEHSNSVNTLTDQIKQREVPDNIVPLQKEATKAKSQDRTSSTEESFAPVEQMLFEHVAGVDDVQNLDFDALRLLKIQGRIVHHNTPMAGIEINGGELGLEYTDQQGRFEFDNVVEGTHYQILINQEGYLMSGTDGLTGVLSDNVTAEIHATRLTQVSGRLTHAGKPLSGIQLDAAEFGSCVSDKDGFYSFENIPEGTKLSITANRTGFTFKRKSSDITQVDIRKQNKEPDSKESQVRKPVVTSASAPVSLKSVKKPDETQDDAFASSLAILTGKQAIAS